MMEETKKSHERVFEHFEKTIDGFAEGILNQNYVTKEDLKIKITACVINAIKISKKQGSHEAQLIVLNEKLKFRSSEYVRKCEEFNLVKKLYVKNLSEIELQEFYKEIENFRKIFKEQNKY